MARFRKLGLLLVAFLAVLLGGSLSARADTITVVGNNTPTLATATVNCSFNAQTNTFTFTVTNTSPFDARITGIGFDLDPDDFSDNNSSGLNNFSGADVGAFTFNNGALGNVPQFNSAVLDFGFVTGGNFSGGDPNDGIAPGGSLTFVVSGTSFTGLTEEEICEAIFVRFQRVGANGQGSDVGRPGEVPEPATLLLLGTGLAGAAGAARRRRKADKP